MRHFPRRLRETGFDGLVQRISRIELKIVRARDARRLASLASTSPKIHLGCGIHVKPGWANIDMWPNPRETPKARNAATFNYDLTRGLPLGDNSCTEIYSSHFLEHLSACQGAALLGECHRILQPGGRLRTCVPDFSRLVRAYLADDADYFAPLYDIFPGRIGDGVPGSDSIMDPVNNGLYQFGEHRCMYDEEKLVKLLIAVGFLQAASSTFDPAIDGTWDFREHFSLYVDAFK